MSATPESSRKEKNELACPICFERYDTKERKPHLIASCGHAVCGECKGKTTVCPTCNRNIKNCCGWTVNYGILDMVEQGNHQMECNGCTVYEKQERMFLCIKCAEMSGFSEKSDDNEIQPFVFCGKCVVEDHLKHGAIKYLPLKCRSLTTEAYVNGIKFVSDMHELCEDEMKKNEELLGKWNTELLKFDGMDWTKLATKPDPLQLSNEIKAESERVCGSTEKAFSELRKTSKEIKDSTSRLRKLFTKALQTSDGEEE